MAADFDVKGLEQLRDLSAALKEVDKSFKLKFAKEVRGVMNPVKGKIQASARQELPKAGGLNVRVAAQKMGVRQRLTGNNPSIRLSVAGMKSMSDIDRGRVRHPLFGNRKRWFSQSVNPKFFTRPTSSSKPAMQAAIREAMEKTAKEISNAVH